MQSLETKNSRPRPKSFEAETRPETFEIETPKNGSRYFITAAYNTVFVKLGVGMMNLVEWEFLLCEWSSIWFSALLFLLC